MTRDPILPRQYYRVAPFNFYRYAEQNRTPRTAGKEWGKMKKQIRIKIFIQVKQAFLVLIYCSFELLRKFSLILLQFIFTSCKKMQ